MNFAIIQNNQVTRVVNSDSDVVELKKLYNADEVRPVPVEFTFIGDERYIDWNTRTLKTLSVRVEEGLALVPDGSVFDGEIIRPMTQIERIESGLEKLPDGFNIKNDRLVYATRDERYAAGQITVAQYNEEVRTERQSRYESKCDKLYFEYIYDLEKKRDAAAVKKQIWLDEIESIKTELPFKNE